MKQGRSLWIHALLVLVWTSLTAGLPAQEYSVYQPDRSAAAIEANCKYDLSVCTVFQDDAPYLKEWIEYYRLLGAQHFILFNDRSTDHYREVLAPYLEQGIVELYDCPCPPYSDGPKWTGYQTKMLNIGLQLSVGVSRWLAIVDTDEFFVPRDTDSLVDFLNAFDGYGQVHARWTCFGTSYVQKVPSNMLMLEALTLRGRYQPGVNWLGKSIVKPHQATSVASAHVCRLKPGVKTYLVNAANTEEFPELRCFHYMFRDEDFLLNVKTPRRKKWLGDKFDPEEGTKRLNAYNDVQDLEMFRFVPQLRERVFGAG